MLIWLEGKVKVELNISNEEPIEPPNKIEKSDNFVGVVADEDVRKLFSLAMQMSKKALENADAAYHADSKELRDQYFEKFEKNKTKSELFLEFFWIAIKERFNLWNKQKIGIRSGWKVVWMEPEASEVANLPPEVLNVIRKIFGKMM